MAVLKEVLVLIVCLLIVRSKAQFTFDDYSTSNGPTSPPPQSTTGAPTVAPTDAPTQAPTVGPTLAPPSSSPGPNLGLDRECGCNHSRIWLDIVAVIDTSLSITQEGLSQVQANLDTIVHELTLSTTPGYSSRISIVTFASNATTVAGLNVFSSTDDFENAIFGVGLSAGDNKVNILSGLQAANSILGASSTQPNRRRVVILYTSAYDNGGFESPLPLSENMREDNIKLITVAFAQSMGSSDVDKVGELAWPSFAFTNNQTDLIDRMYDALCQANCFCPANWRQFSKNFNDKYAHGYGICLFHSSIQSAWTPASHACRTEAPGAYLVTETTQEKHNFNFAYANASSIDKQYSYHIGLEYKSGQYSWQQSNQGVTVPLSSGGYTLWNPTYPNINAGACVKVDKIFGNQYKWTNENCWSALNYICEVNSCDTDNYCP